MAWKDTRVILGKKKGSSKVSARQKLKLGKEKRSSKVSAEPEASGIKDMVELSQKEQLEPMKAWFLADIGRRMPESDSGE